MSIKLVKKSANFPHLEIIVYFPCAITKLMWNFLAVINSVTCRDREAQPFMWFLCPAAPDRLFSYHNPRLHNTRRRLNLARQKVFATDDAAKHLRRIWARKDLRCLLCSERLLLCASAATQIHRPCASGRLAGNLFIRPRLNVMRAP
jgi:hypothetical protein